MRCTIVTAVKLKINYNVYFYYSSLIQKVNKDNSYIEVYAKIKMYREMKYYSLDRDI